MSTPLPQIGGVPAGIQRGGGSPTGPTQIVSASVSIDDALAVLAMIEGVYDGFTITGGMPNNDYDVQGNLIDTIDVYFSVTGHPGSFTVSVERTQNWPGEATAQIGFKKATIDALYTLS